MKGEMRLRRLLDRVTYKPGVVLKLSRTKDYMNLGMFVETQDSDDPSKKIVVTTFFYIDADFVKSKTDTELLAWIMDRVAGFELHEVLEWFKVDGEHFVAPHPNGWLYGEHDRKKLDEFYAHILKESGGPDK